MQQTNVRRPEIRINFSWLLYRSESRILGLHYNKGQDKMSSAEPFKQLTKDYREDWAKYEKQVLDGMCNILGVSFYRPVIDVSLAPYFVPHSNPLIINFRYEPDKFVDILAHELIHVLLTDNNVHQSNSVEPKLNLISVWTELFGRHDIFTLAHIPVYAIHKQLYLDVLKAPERLERDIAAKQSETGKAYAEAWEYVNQRDYAEIVNKLRGIYRDSA
jgi:hypothetical protein